MGGVDATPVNLRDNAHGLAVAAVTKHFGGVYAVNDVSLHCAPNEIVGLIGPNGAGKTTLMNVISGSVLADKGEIRVGERRVDGLPPEQCARLGIARTFQNTRVFSKLSALQNIEVAYTTAMRHRESVGATPPDILALLELESVAHLKSETLAYGIQRRVEIARALALSPDVLLLDEPAAGMNAQETEALLQIIRQIRTRFGFAIIVIDHDLRFIMNLCDRIYVMHMGRIIAEDAPAAIRNNAMVQEVYLGKRKFGERVAVA